MHADIIQDNGNNFEEFYPNYTDLYVM